MFVPVDALIGGPAYAGQGWRMLVECLSIGRSISLPSNATGGAQMGALATTAYARLRRQFNMAIGHFEGVQEALARILGNTYAVTALSRATAAAVDRGEKPAVPSAIAKFHTTELAREVARDAMDIHGGKGVILGPKNYLGRAWQGAPIAITVEGANILTRSLMIFGQGAIRCHPLVLKEMQALQEPDPDTRLQLFDRLLFAHVGMAISNAVRAFWLGLIHARIGRSPAHRDTAKYFRKLDRYAAALGLCADIAMLSLGGKLKMKERLSARLGDVLGELYIASAVLKRYEDQGRPESDRMLLAWTLHERVHRMQVALGGFVDNFPVRWLGVFMRLVLSPSAAVNALLPTALAGACAHSCWRLRKPATACARGLPHRQRQQRGWPHGPDPAAGDPGRADRTQVRQGDAWPARGIVRIRGAAGRSGGRRDPVASRGRPAGPGALGDHGVHPRR